jgi:drug/metabolite transporter (DMT)-like permease
LPPFWLIATRYFLSGSILLVAAALSGLHIPRGRELWLTALCGVICIGTGNSCLALAESYIPSGLAALFYTTAPFWMIGVDALLPHGKRPLVATMGGLLVGLGGVIYLIYPAAVREGLHGKTVVGFLLMQLSVAGWVLGSLLQKRVHSKSMPFVTGGVQQLATGLTLSIPAVLTEHFPHHTAMRPILAVAYLVTFGSILGYSSFIYSLKHLPVAVVSIYTFVNPIVAVFLGWLIFREPFGVRGLVAMLIIFAGIGLVRRSESTNARQLALASEHEIG